MQNYGRTETRLGESGFLIGENQRCKYFWYSGIISSVKETEIDVVFHDPKGFLKDAVIHYFWFINTVNYGQTPTVRYWIFQCSGCLNILHLPGPLWVQLHKPRGLWCGSDSDCIFQCRFGQSYHKTFCLFASNYFRSKLPFFPCRAKFNLGTIKLEYC